MTRWIDHVKQWSKDNNSSYGCSLTNEQCKKEYHDKYPKVVKKGKAKPRIHKPDEMQEMPYREKTPLTREMRKALAEAKDEDTSRKLLPVRSDREKELEEMDLDELKDIVNDEKIKGSPKTKSSHIKAILKHEGIPKGAKLSEKDMDLLETQTMALNMRYKGEKGISARFKKIADLKNQLKKTSDIMERKKLENTIERLSAVVSEEKKALKHRIDGRGVVMHTAENTNGLTHVYPLSHSRILELCQE